MFLTLEMAIVMHIIICITGKLAKKIIDKKVEKLGYVWNIKEDEEIEKWYTVVGNHALGILLSHLKIYIFSYFLIVIITLLFMGKASDSKLKEIIDKSDALTKKI